MSVKRYKPVGVNHSSVYLDPAADGDVVLHADHAAEVERLQNKLNQDSQNFEIECLRETERVLRARVRELEAAIREHLRLEDTTESDDPGVGIDRYNARQKLAALAAVSAETEDAS